MKSYNFKEGPTKPLKEYQANSLFPYCCIAAIVLRSVCKIRK